MCRNWVPLCLFVSWVEKGSTLSCFYFESLIFLSFACFFVFCFVFVLCHMQVGLYVGAITPEMWKSCTIVECCRSVCAVIAGALLRRRSCRVFLWFCCEAGRASAPSYFWLQSYVLCTTHVLFWALSFDCVFPLVGFIYLFRMIILFVLLLLAVV